MCRPKAVKVGVLGYGHLGQYLVEQILKSEGLELAFVWNRSIDTFKGKVDEKYILRDIQHFSQRAVDLIVEVAHPKITEEYGPLFLQHADYLIGSPSALADLELETSLREAATKHGLYVPAGALWGVEDIKKMADRGTLQALKVTMTKDPSSFKLNGYLKEEVTKVKDKRTVLYDGPVRNLCPLAPNNVNTMAAAAMAAHNLGFDKVQGSIIADPNMPDWHTVEIEVWGPGDIQAGKAFHVKTVRSNPAQPGNVTGSATYASFFSSIKACCGRGPGVHLC